jgi:signal transduction histidine kinase
MRMDSHEEIGRLRLRITELERQNEEIERFAAVAAHELLTPVVLIDACAATVDDRLDGDERHVESRRDLDVLRRGCMQSRLLVESLLLHAASGDRPMRVGRVALQALVGDCVALLKPEIRARGATVEIGELPVVPGEAPLLAAVVNNLLVNALKYGPREPATIRIGAERDGAAWRVHVESEGEPIPPEDRERIFRPRTRGRGECRARGCGLGLTICREIVERHGGQIGVAPAEGGTGNRFAFTLPAGPRE